MPTQVDEQYSAKIRALKATIEGGTLLTFQQMFQIVPKTAISKPMGINYHTFTRKVGDPTLFSLKELEVIAELIGVSPRLLADRIFTDIGK